MVLAQELTHSDGKGPDLEANSYELVKSFVKEVSFDGATGAVVLSLQPKGPLRED